MKTYIVSFEHGPHMSDKFEVEARNENEAWAKTVSYCGYGYITRNWIELKEVIEARNVVVAITAQERKEAWEADFKILMEKHSAYIDVVGGYDGRTGEIEISMSGEWDKDGNVVKACTEFELET